jgi:excisionase family DNA binding protein
MTREEKARDTTPLKILTIREVCEYLHLSPATVYRILRRTDIPAFRIGKSWRFSLLELDRWIERRSLQDEPSEQHEQERRR